MLPTPNPACRPDQPGLVPEALGPPHRGHGGLHRQRLLRHGHDHRHRLGPAPHHRGGGRHHDHCPEVRRRGGVGMGQCENVTSRLSWPKYRHDNPLNILKTLKTNWNHLTLHFVNSN